MPVTQAIKRDGRLVPFEPERITTAILKAGAAVGLEDRALAEPLTGRVVELLEEQFPTQAPSVEDIQDVVEKVLIESRHANLAKAYILYRQKRGEIRAAKRFLGVMDDLKLTVNAVRVLNRRYLIKNEAGEVIETPRQLFQRVAKAVAATDTVYDPKADIDAVTAQFYEQLVSLKFMPNSPTLMNAGTDIGQLSACFVLPVEDSIEGIFDSLKHMAIIHKSGGGTGFSFARLRPAGDIVRTTTGIASGPISFMRIYDTATDVIKQGGRRRGANMGILRVDHPDVLDFITAKERADVLPNFNISVAVTEDFMRAVAEDGTLTLVNPRTQRPVRNLRARDVFDLIVTMAWRTGDPGLAFLDRINEAHPLREVGEIESTNPCVVGQALVSTQLGLLRMSELARRHPTGGVSVATDDRVPILTGSQMVSTLDGGGAGGVSMNPILRAFPSGVKETVRVSTKGGFELEVTPDHKIMTTESWVRAGELRPGEHRVLIQCGAGHFGQERRLPIAIQNVAIGKNGRTYRLNLPTEWSFDLGLVLGSLVGDGCLWIGEKDRRVLFTFGSNDTRDLERIRSILQRWYPTPIMSQTVRGVSRLSIHSKFLVDFFARLGVMPSMAQDRRVPSAIFTAPVDAVAGFLCGLFSADGTVGYVPDKSAYIRLTSKYRRLLQDVQLLLLNLGMKSRIRDGEMYELELSRASARIFARAVGFMNNKHADKLGQIHSHGFYSTRFDDLVVAVEPVGLQPVYDLTEPATHSFVANGMVVSNCGEVPLLPYESCNLGSINLTKFVRDGRIDWDDLRRTVHISVHFLDNVIDASNFPLKEITEVTHANRKIGLGVMGFAELLIMLGISYNSDDALQMAEKVMAFIYDEAKNKSIELAEARGPFPNFGKSAWRQQVDAIRHATLTTIAPTGTISIIAGCSSGIEPLFAVTYMREVMEGTRLLEVNPYFERIARERGFYSDELMRRVARVGSIQEFDDIPEDVRRLFVTTFDVPGEQHVRIQAAFQNHVDNAVSKTVNLAADVTFEAVRRIYLLAHELKCKGITVYRYGSKPTQVLFLEERERPAEKLVRADTEYAGGCPSGECAF